MLSGGSVQKHISTYLKHDGVFEPRIPSYRHKQQEDSTTPRVSVAPTLEDCLTAIPGGGTYLDELNLEQRGYYQEMVPCGVGIRNVQYRTDLLKKGEDVSLYLNDEIEADIMRSYVNEIKEVEITEEYPDEITIEAKR